MSYNPGLLVSIQAPVAATSVTGASQVMLADNTYATVTAVLAVGGSTAPAVPGQVTGLTAGTITASSIGISYTAPTSGGAQTGYAVTCTPSGGAAVTTAVTGTSATLSGLVASKAYSITVAATNASGTGLASSAITATTLAAAAASNVNTIYTVRNLSGNAWPSPFALSGGAYGAIGGLTSIKDVNGSTPASIPAVALSSSSAVPPVSGTAGGEYGINPNDSQPGSLVNPTTYPGVWGPSGTMYLWANGHAAGTVRNLYVWFKLPDATWALLTNTDGTPYAIVVTY